MTDWVRLWHDMPTDPKWRTIARKSGQRVGDVMAVFNFIMVNASANSGERGTLNGFDVEDVATALDLEDDDVRAIIAAMQGKVLDGDRLTAWEKRQPKREDGTAAKRKAEWKERQKNAPERSGTHGNAPETETETETDITPKGVCASGDAPTPDDIAEVWNELAPHIGKPLIRKLTPERRQMVKARLAQNNLDDFRTVFGNIRGSPFLRGDTGWTSLGFDWVMKKANFQKILEGNYNGR